MRTLKTVLFAFMWWATIAWPSFSSATTYDSLVNKAELAILDSNYFEAFRFYKKAITASEGEPFAYDLYNASVCAVKAGENRRAIAVCSLLSKKGVGERFFLQSVYLPLRDHPEWNKLLSEAAINKELVARKAGGLRRLVDSLVEKDQMVNKNWRASGMASEEREIMDLTYDTISTHLHRLFDSLGFLSEEQLGANMVNDTTVSLQSPFDIIIIHNYQSRMRGDTLFNGILRSALNEHVIKPDHYASLHDFNGGDKGEYFGTSHLYVQYKCSLYRERQPFVPVERIELDRKRIGLPPLADYERKLQHRLSGKRVPVRIYTPISIYKSFKDEYSEKQFLESHELVIEQIQNCMD